MESADPKTLEDCVAVALVQNPVVQTARKKVEAAGYRVPQAASLEDPNVNISSYPIYPNVQQVTSGRMTAMVTASQKLPWIGKLRTQAEAAEAETNMARAELASAELDVISQVKRAYFELHYLQTAIRITIEERKLLADLTSIAEGRYRVSKASQQDVLRAQLEALSVENDLIRMRQELTAGRAKLARLMHSSPESPLETSLELASEAIPRDLERLYQQALVRRPELQSQLAAIHRDRKKVDLANLQYYPDITVAAGWEGMTTRRAMSPLADGVDNVTMGLMANIPLYRKRLSAGVREAEAQAVSSAREYDSLRDQTLEDIKTLFSQALSQQELIDLFRDDILPKARQTLKVSTEAYQTGEVDFLQLVDNWRQVLRFEIARQRLESQLRQTIAELDRVVGGGATVLNEPPPAQPADPAPGAPLNAGRSAAMKPGGAA